MTAIQQQATRRVTRRAGPTTATDFSALFDALAGQRAGSEGPRLTAARQAAMARFADHGLPTRKSEWWRYVNLTPFTREVFTLPPTGTEPEGCAEAVAERRLDEAAATLVFVDGHCSRQLSHLPEGLGLRPLCEWLGRDDEFILAAAQSEGSQERPFLDLNTALFGDGAALVVPEGAELGGPIHLLFLHSTGSGEQGGVRPASFARVLIQLESGARATVIEEHISVGPTSREGGVALAAPVTQVRLGQGSCLHQVRLQDTQVEQLIFASVDVELGRDAQWRGISLQVGGAIAREEIRVRTTATGGDCALLCLGLGDGKRTVDLQADVVHATPHCTSRQTYRGVVDDQARAIFNSRVAVERGAVGTDSGQSAKSLLLSDDAVADTKPQLEVLNDDVKCFHGATTGELDADALFFLRSRGIGPDRARAMLTLAFAGEVVDAIPVPSLCARLRADLDTRLANAKV